MSTTLPPYDSKRQADAVIRAYRFQFLETAIAWLELGPSETLLVEIAEDFDIQSGGGNTKLAQVTHSSTDRRLTLASKKTREALTNFWSASSEGADPSISLVLLTNMPAGKEARFEFPNDMTGIDYWVQVQAGADPMPLWDALKAILEPGSLRDWLETEVSQSEFSAKLVSRIEWRMAQDAGPERTAVLTALLTSRLSALGLPTSIAVNATPIVIQRILETASNPDISLRCLKASDVNSLLNEIVRPGQPGHEAQWNLASWTSLLTELPLPGICAARSSFVGSLAAQLQSGGYLWLNGASGTGKSTLAHQTANYVGGTWLLVDFRNQDQPIEIFNRLDRVYTDVTLTEGSAGVILDDVKPDLLSEHALRLSMLLKWLNNKRIHVVLTSAQAPSPALASRFGLQHGAVVDAPYLEQADIHEMVQIASAPTNMLDAWSHFIQASTAFGHPQLAAAKVASLAFRSWPETALTEDLLGSVSDAVSLTRSEARRRLLREATEDGRALLKRLACILLRFDRSMAVAAASVDPAVPDPSASLDFLIGPWIEPAPGPGHYLRLSPLLYGLNEDLSQEIKEAVQSSVVIGTIQNGPIPFEALDVVVWNAVLGQQAWFFPHFFKTLMDQSEEQSAALASKLSSILFLRTDRLVFSEEPIASVFLRLLQVDIAAINRDQRMFQDVAEAALRECQMLNDEDARRGMYIMTLSKILFARGGKLDWVTRIAWLNEYDAVSQIDPLILEMSGCSAVADLKAEFGQSADVPGFLITIGLQTIETPDDLQELFDALDGLSDEVRQRWLEQLRAYSGAYDLYIQAAWANAWFAGKLNAERAVAAYENMEDQARSWAEHPLVHQCVVAQSVLWDEIQKDRRRAIAVVDQALEIYPENSTLLRQKAKVLGHDGDYEAARTILNALRPELDQRSSVEQLYVLKEEAVAAAKLGDFDDAHSLFLRAADAGDDLIEDMVDLKCHKIALRAEAAICSWRLGEHVKALSALAPVLEDTSRIDPKSSDAAWMLHVKMRWLIGWLDRSTQIPQGDPPPALSPGAMSALDDEVTDEHRVDRGSFEDAKLLLLISAHRNGLSALDFSIDWSKTSPGFHLFLVGAEFDLAVDTKQPETIATAILNVAAAFLIVSNAKSEAAPPTALPIQGGGGVTLQDIASEPMRSVLRQLLALAAFRHMQEVSVDPKFQSRIIDVLAHRLGDDDGILFSNMQNTFSGEIVQPADNATQVISALLDKETQPLHPMSLIHYHLNLAACAVSSGAGVRTSHAVLRAIAEDWTYVVDRQRFLLSQPNLYVPQMNEAITNLLVFEPGALNRLLQVAASALGSALPRDWQGILDRLGGKILKIDTDENVKKYQKANLQ